MPKARYGVGQLTDNFLLGEFIQTSMAEWVLLEVQAKAEFVSRLTALAEALEVLRAVLGTPIRITSGWRGRKHNRRVGGSVTSDHLTGWAADIQAQGLAPQVAYLALKQLDDLGEVELDQVIQYPTHVHVSVSPRYRRQFWKS